MAMIAIWSVRVIGPVLAALALAMIVSNLALPRQEGWQRINLVVILGCTAALGCLAAVYAADVFPEIVRRILGAGCAVVTLLSVNLLVQCLRAFHYSDSPHTEADVLLVLGSALRRDGSMTPMLTGRLDLALALDKAHGGRTVLVLSGGQMKSEPVVEATVMHAYLKTHGIPDERMLDEGRSMDTAENMHYSAQLIRERFPNARVVVVTSRPHELRATLLARREGLNVTSLGSRMPWFYWANAIAREYLGMLMLHFHRNCAILAAAALAALLL